MGKFLNKTYVKSIDSIINKTIDNLHNPYYKFNDKAPTTVTYYNINVEASNLDEGTGTSYSYTSLDSSLRFNKIKDFILYGIDRVQTQIEAGDFGAESETIEGEAILLPNTIKPFPQDYFSINHLGKNILFKISNVSLDTMPNGVNTYRLNYRLSTVSRDTDIDNLVVKNFTMITNNLGTNLASVIEDNDYAYCARLEKITDFLKSIYRSLFYSDKTQTFVFSYDDKNFYDPYCIEFIIRHELMKSSELPYLHIEHQLWPGTLFPIEYTKTFFYSLETKPRLEKLCNPSYEATLITDQTSLLSKFAEAYYVVHFYKMGNRYPVYTFDDNTVSIIKDKEFYKADSPEYFKNILIMYFNNMDFDEKTLEVYEDFDFTNTPANEMYYYIPAAIYIFERTIMDKMKKLAD